MSSRSVHRVGWLSCKSYLFRMEVLYSGQLPPMEGIAVVAAVEGCNLAAVAERNPVEDIAAAVRIEVAEHTAFAAVAAAAHTHRF